MNPMATEWATHSRRRPWPAVTLLLALGGIAGCEGAADIEGPTSGRAVVHSATAEPVEADRLARLEARLEETEARLMQAERRAAAAEAQARHAITQARVAPGGGPALGQPAVGRAMRDAPAVAHLTEAEIKASATGVNDGRLVAPGGDPALGQPAVGRAMRDAPTVEPLTEAELKASATGVNDGAAEPAPAPEARGERRDLP